MQLVEHEGLADGWSTLDVRSFPFIVGNSPDDVSWECVCGRQIGVGLFARQVLNILIRCGDCSRLLESPLREPGEPIAGRPVYMSPDKVYLIEGVLDVSDKPVMMVGHKALFDYSRETGQRVPNVYEPDRTPVVNGFDEESFLALGSGLRSLLGVDYERLDTSDTRGQNSRTPPSSRHRIIELIKFATKTAERLRDWDGRARFDLDGNLLAEAMTALTMATRWRHHPAWPALRATLTSETEPPHTVTLLTAASYLVDAGNGVGVHVTTTQQGAPTADLWIAPKLGERVDMEVKTPLALRGPKSTLSQEHAIQILERALKKSGRQRGNTRTSLLVVGGYHLGPSYERMLSTAKAILALERRRWRGLAGIVVTDCTYETTDRSRVGPGHFRPMMRVDIALHPGYLGDIAIRAEPDATLRLPE